VESTSRLEAAEQLEIVQIAEQATYEPRKIPRWYTPGVATAVAVQWAVQDSHSIALKLVVTVGFAVALGVLVSAAFQAQGRQPRMWKMPRALRNNVWLGAIVLLVVIGVVFGAVGLLKLHRPWLWCAGLGFIIVNIAGPLMERSYRAAYTRWRATQ
jgi:nicotinamide riboside transporter PnuC